MESLFKDNTSIVDRKDFYYGTPELMDRTRKRLQEIVDAGMTEVGAAQFGVVGIMSGLYIERVWSYSDEDFNSYMDWAKNLIKERNNIVL